MKHFSSGTSAFALPFLLIASAVAQSPATIRYVSVNGADTNDGTTAAKPVRTVAKALALIGSVGGTVRVTAGRFDEPPIVLPANVVIDGSWRTDFTEQTAFTTAELRALTVDSKICDLHTCLTTTQGDRVMTVSAYGSTLSQLALLGPDRAAAVGSSSYALVVDGANMKLISVVVKAGAGGVGESGKPGAPGAGLCTYGGDGGYVTKEDKISLKHWCSTHDGSVGEPQSLGERTANGGLGGTPGKTDCSIKPYAKFSKSNGNSGGSGDLGIEGPPGGISPADNGAFTRSQGALQWGTSNHGSPGLDGSAGGGGGGGGPGSSWKQYGWCGIAYSITGGGGHVGSRGGCAGHGGQGGNSGGASFALVVNDGTVTTQQLVLFGGQGGVGGVGGDGSRGVVGEVNTDSGESGHGTKVCGKTLRGGTGGPGGNGGQGGGGGGGGGGNGGPSFTLATIGKGSVVDQGGVYRVIGGRAGLGGVGGRSADSSIAAPGGSPGIQENVIQLELHKLIVFSNN